MRIIDVPARKAVCWRVYQPMESALPLHQQVPLLPYKSVAAKPQRVTHCSASDPWCHRLDNCRDNPHRSNANLVPAADNIFLNI